MPTFCRKVPPTMERSLPYQNIEESKVLNFGVDMEKLARIVEVNFHFRWN